MQSAELSRGRHLGGRGERSAVPTCPTCANKAIGKLDRMISRRSMQYNGSGCAGRYMLRALAFGALGALGARAR
jgi:hypothetical protein